MATFVSLATVKTILWITDNSDDTRLTAILEGVLSQVSLQIWNIEEWEKSEYFPVNMESVKKWFLPLSVINPTAIKEIDWVDFTTKVNWTDYLILDDGTAQVIDLSSFISTSFDKFKVKYTAWYSAPPDDFENIIATMVGLEFSKDLWRDVIEEQTWPRTVKWSDPSRWQGWADAAQKSVASRLRKYIPVHLRIF